MVPDLSTFLFLNYNLIDIQVIAIIIVNSLFTYSLLTIHYPQTQHSPFNSFYPLPNSFISENMHPGFTNIFTFQMIVMLKKYALVFLVLLPFLGQAQFGNIMKKTKDKVIQRADQKVDKGIDKKLDQLEGKEPSASPAPASTTPSTASASTPQPEKETIKAYSKFDFVPGERILYAEDFSQDAIGELPLTWNSSGKGEVMTMENKQGKWLRAFQNNTYLTGNKTRFGENYTIEFDLLFYFEPKVKGYVLPGWSFGLFSSGANDATGNAYLKDRSEINSTEVRFGYGSYALAVVESREKRATSFQSDKMTLGEVLPSFNKVIHY